MAAQTQTIESPKTKRCRGCLMRLPLTEFRFMNRAKGTRHSRCRDCRRMKDSKQVEKTRRDALTGGMRRMRKAKTVEQLRNIVEAVTAELPGGIPGLVTTLVEHSKESRYSRSRIAKTLLHAACACDLAEIQLKKHKFEESAAATVRRLHRDYKLVPVLREMIEAGELSLDDIDPPPFAPPE